MVRPEIAELGEWLVDVRREIHRNPELGYREFATAALAARILSGLDFEVKTGVGGTGVVGLWRTGKPGPVVGLRADMDALPITEAVEAPWRSSVPGVMHACGHDLHTAMLLGAARVLAGNPEYAKRLHGAVKFIFQPAEEGGGGAAAMIADGVLADPPLDAAFAAHVVPTIEVGRLGYRYGVALAAVDTFTIRVVGRGGHAAHPELAADPVAPTAGLIGRLKDKAGTVDQTLLAVTMFNAGTQSNIIPAAAELVGTVRSLDADRRTEVLDIVRRSCRELERETRLKVELSLENGYPMLVNHPGMMDMAVEAAAEKLGRQNVLEQGPSFGAEDMAYFLERVPGAHYWLGCGRPGEKSPAMLHSPEFDPDESALPIGVEIMVTLAEKMLGGR